MPGPFFHVWIMAMQIDTPETPSTIITTPRLTLRPPLIDGLGELEADDIAQWAGGADAAARMLEGARFVILRERAIGCVGHDGSVTLGERWRDAGFEAEVAMAVAQRRGEGVSA
jgi:hypothetical protein